jgi:major membrane immunogen (membrane-anchored lipoprotein)
MKTLTSILMVLVLFSGCANFNPKSRINNSNGKINDINNNQNGMMLELGKLKQDAEILNSKLKEVQNGLLNLNMAISRNENTGIQVLQGDGSLFLVFSCIALVCMFYFKNRDNEDTMKLLAEKIMESQDENLQESVVDAAMEKNKGEKVLSLLKKAKK